VAQVFTYTLSAYCCKEAAHIVFTRC